MSHPSQIFRIWWFCAQLLLIIVAVNPRRHRAWQLWCENLQFSYVLFVILLFYVLDVASITVNDRHTLLNIGSSFAQRKPDFEFLNAGALFTDTPLEPIVWAARSRPWKCRRGKEPVSLSDSDAVPSYLLYQPFCWLTFSHWTTNSVNCGHVSHTNEKQGTAALFASQKPGCLKWFQTQPPSLRGSPCIARTEWNNPQGKEEVGCLFLYQQLVVWWKKPTLY